MLMRPAMICFLNACFFLSGFVIHAQDTTRLSLIFLGDIMQHGSQISDAYDPVLKRYDYNPCFQYVKPYTETADLAIGNFELTLAGPPYKGYPQFSAPDVLLGAMKYMGIDVLVTANNHCVDRGRQGLERTIEQLDSAGILHTGTFADEVERLNLNPLLIEKSGFRIALLNYTFSTNGLPVYKPNIVNMIDKELIRKDMLRARELMPDAIVVFTHWGIEYQSLPSEWQKDIANFCFAQGAMIVIGAHPHVVQPMEWNKQKNQLIAYSLGNFVSGQRKRYTDGGAMVRVELEKVKLASNVTVTGIDTAGYILQWVHKKPGAGRNYYILPVPTVEKEPDAYIHDQESKTAFKTFVSDSRALFVKHNVNVGEFNSAPEYLVRFKGTAADTLIVRQYPECAGSVKVINDGSHQKIEIGPFTGPDANFFSQKIKLKVDSIYRKN
jgi:poly-gamma-glutamate capsule biosynthesis protein CapA/YwtB (metallophosphatase superfamily)